MQTFNVDVANELTNVSRGGTFTLNGAIPAPATNVTVNGLAAQTYGDFTFARTNLALLNGNNTFTNIAQNIYGARATNIFTVNLPSSVGLNYDNDGNLTNDGTKAYGFDAENQLTNVMVAGQWQSSFVYDGLNRRRITRDYSWSGSAWVKTNETRLIYDGYQIIQERDTNNNPLVTYTRGLDMSGSLSGAGGIGGLLARTDTNGSTFYHADGAGNITAMMDGSENIVGRYLYNPFGKLVGQWGSMAGVNEMQFSSMPFYRKPGIYGYWGRFYDPNLQRWLNQDPVQELGGINLYRFVGNNALRSIDPLGLAGVEEEQPVGEITGEILDHLADGRERSPTLAQSQADDEAIRDGEAANQRNERDPNGSYLETDPNSLKPLTDAQYKQNIANAVNDLDKFRNGVACPTIYRGGRPSPSNLKTRPGEDALSFRNSLSNPLPNTGRPVFRPDDDYFGIDTSKLPPNSVIYDNSPPGHVSVQGVPFEVLKNAVVEKGGF